MTTDETFQQLETAWQSAGQPGLLKAVEAEVRQQGDFHRLFDLRLLTRKQELGLPLLRPTSFEDVPKDQRDTFEQTYLAAAREVGLLFLERQELAAAHLYFQAIRDLEPLVAAIEQFPIPQATTPASEAVIEVALFKGVAPAKGLAVMLKTHGTCSTITALDQQFGQLKSEDRRNCAAQLVQRLHTDLMHNVRTEVQQRMPFAPPASTLRELTAARDWLFADNNYHIDVSHLSSTVRFARSLTKADPELVLARDLTEYGAQLGSPFQYPSDPPFADFYTAHRHFFNVLLGEQVEVSLQYFQDQLDKSDEPAERALIAYVLVDLLVRIERIPAAVDLARAHLVNHDEDFFAMFAELCAQSNQYEAWRKSAQERRDVVAFTAALLSQTQSEPTQ